MGGILQRFCKRLGKAFFTGTQGGPLGVSLIKNLRSCDMRLACYATTCNNSRNSTPTMTKSNRDVFEGRQAKKDTEQPSAEKEPVW